MFAPLGGLGELERLALPCSPLAAVPAAVGRLTQLTLLSLSGWESPLFGSALACESSLTRSTGRRVGGQFIGPARAQPSVYAFAVPRHNAAGRDHACMHACMCCEAWPWPCGEQLATGTAFCHGTPGHRAPVFKESACCRAGCSPWEHLGSGWREGGFEAVKNLVCLRCACTLPWPVWQHVLRRCSRHLARAVGDGSLRESSLMRATCEVLPAGQVYVYVWRVRASVALPGMQVPGADSLWA